MARGQADSPVSPSSRISAALPREALPVPLPGFDGGAYRRWAAAARAS